MQEPRILANEQDRLETLLKLKILDTPDEDRYDRYTRICTRLFDAPIAIICLIDKYRAWFKSTSGLDTKANDRKYSFCAHAIHDDEIFEVSDALQDPRFRDNPLVTELPNIRFYAGAQLKTPNGHNIGTLCIIDRCPRTLNMEERILLKNLADMVVSDMVRYIDLATGLGNRNALILACEKCLEKSKPEKTFSLTLFDINETVSSYNSADVKKTTTENFTNKLQKYFPEALSLAHLGSNHFCVLLEKQTNFNEEQAINQFYADSGLSLGDTPGNHSFPSLVGRIDLNRDKHPAAEDLLREIDGLFFRKEEQALPAKNGKH